MSLGQHPAQAEAVKQIVARANGESVPIVGLSQPETAPPYSRPLPTMAAPNTAAPAISRPAQAQTQTGADQAELNRLKTTGSGISQIHNPFLRGLARTGEIAGSVAGFSPELAMVPGTEIHHQALIGRAGRQLAADIGQEKETAGIAHTKAETEKQQAETENLKKPDAIEPKYEKTDDGSIVSLVADPQTGTTKSEVVYHGNGKDPKDPFQLWQKQNPGGKVEDFLKLQGENKTPKENDFQQYYSDFLKDNGLIDSAHNRLKAREQWSKANQPFGQQHVDIALAGLTDKRQAALEKKTAPLQQSIDDANQAHQLAKIGDAGNAEADIDLALSFFKTMRSGGQGIKFTRQEQDLIMGARNSGHDLLAIGQKVIGSGQKFTPEQRKKIVEVIDLHSQAAQQALSRIQGGKEEPETAPSAPKPQGTWNPQKGRYE